MTRDDETGRVLRDNAGSLSAQWMQPAPALRSGRK
jgi:hypothetical protein